MSGVSGRSGGRNAKTKQQHDTEGTTRPGRHKGLANPDPPSGQPVPPKPLDGDAKDEWDRMIGRLEASQTLSTVDDGALYQYCRLFAETEAIAVTQLETAATIDLLEENLSGPKEERENLLQVAQEITKLKQLEARYTTQIRQGRMAVRTYLVEFGLTPAARSRVKVTTAAHDEQPASPLAQLQQQARALRRVK